MTRPEENGPVGSAEPAGSADPAHAAAPAEGAGKAGHAENGGSGGNGGIGGNGEARPAGPAGGARTGEGRHGKRPGEVPHSRTGALWVGICVTVLVLGLLIVFIAQNTETVDVTFLWMNGTVPLAVALLIAAAGAGLLAAIVGTVRIAQLRRLNRRS